MPFTLEKRDRLFLLHRKPSRTGVATTVSVFVYRPQPVDDAGGGEPWLVNVTNQCAIKLRVGYQQQTKTMLYRSDIDLYKDLGPEICRNLGVAVFGDPQAFTFEWIK